jgi:hypothetical protein
MPLLSLHFHKHYMSIHDYIWFYIENEEEIEVEEELHHHLKTHLPGTAFILIFVEQSPTVL